MSFRFEKLNIWHDARAFANLIYDLTALFPKDERFGLVDQLRRAVVSVVLNISEGSDRKSDAEFKRFLRMSITSINEVVTALYLSLDRKFIAKQDFDKAYDVANKLAARINATINSLSKKQ